MDRDCKDCVFSSPHNSTMKCGYPAPEWIKIQILGMGIVHGYEAKNCSTYKSKIDVVNEAKSKESK
jgi:hypothetical protein